MYPKRQLLLLSSSSPYGYSYLDYAKKDAIDFLTKNNVSKILFIPYAVRDHDDYEKTVKKVVEDQWKYKVESIHRTDDPVSAVNKAQAIFIGGGNTFQLLKGLYDNNIVEPIRKRVLQDGVPYIGSSAGTNVATLNICTTNDMPIVYPPTFDALRLLSFNINPHYLDAVPGDKHQGETREERILQYLEIPNMGPVLGLREGATLHVEGSQASLKGVATARLFQRGEAPAEYEIGSDLSFLMD